MNDPFVPGPRCSVAGATSGSLAAMSASVRTLCQHGASPCLGWSQSQKSKVTASPRGGVESNRR
jgi:hypothetical protein